MSDESLTYRSSGVDVEENLEANRRIQAYTRDTHTEQVLTRGGLFGGAVALPAGPAAGRIRYLAGRLFSAEGDSPEQISRRIARSCRSPLETNTIPVAFLDYLAAANLDALRAANLVGLFSRDFAAPPRIPIIGGETAEMPDVFEEDAWEVVGALFAAAETPVGAGKAAQRQERVELSGLSEMEQPALVFSMDGVGTKTKIGVACGRTSGLALDLIHHSLDDILCQGARGLGFMLYLGCAGRDERIVEPLIETARECCRNNGMVLLDCLVREKPYLYRPGEIDLCGAIAGAVDARRLIQGDAIRPGDLLLGLPSSGLHTNGYSLARKSLLERASLPLDRVPDELGRTVGEALLEPHRNYAPHLLPLLAERELGEAIKGVAHITGGGLPDNLERILPPGLVAEIRLDSWRPPAIFDLIRRSGNIPLHDPEGKGMYESFNMGIGLVLVVDTEPAERIRERLRGSGLEAVEIGRVLESAAGESGAGEYGAGKSAAGESGAGEYGAGKSAAGESGAGPPSGSAERVVLL